MVVTNQIFVCGLNIYALCLIRYRFALISTTNLSFWMLEIIDKTDKGIAQWLILAWHQWGRLLNTWRCDCGYFFFKLATTLSWKYAFCVAFEWFFYYWWLMASEFRRLPRRPSILPCFLLCVAMALIFKGQMLMGCVWNRQQNKKNRNKIWKWNLALSEGWDFCFVATASAMFCSCFICRIVSVWTVRCALPRDPMALARRHAPWSCRGNTFFFDSHLSSFG